MSDLHEVVLGNPVARGDLGDRRQPVFLKRQIHQKAQRIVRLNGQVQRASPINTKICILHIAFMQALCKDARVMHL
jgi:hypothetical protein